MGEFSIYLPSNTTFLPSNKSWKYVTKLAREVNLNDDWECALTEIQYKRSWFNIVERENNFYIQDIDREKWYHITIPIGYYQNEQHLIETINTLLKTHKVKISFNIATRKIQIKIPNHIQIVFTRALAGIMGISYIQTTCSGPLYEGQFAMEMTRGIDSIYVYSDIIQTKLVGDSCVPLLRIVPVSGKFGEEICKEYNSPLYSRVAKHNFTTIEIYLTDSAGRHIPFTSGKVTVLLHFRKRK